MVITAHQHMTKQMTKDVCFLNGLPQMFEDLPHLLINFPEMCSICLSLNQVSHCSDYNNMYGINPVQFPKVTISSPHTTADFLAYHFWPCSLVFLYTLPEILSAAPVKGKEQCTLSWHYANMVTNWSMLDRNVRAEIRRNASSLGIFDHWKTEFRKMLFFSFCSLLHFIYSLMIFGKSWDVTKLPKKAGNSLQ